MSATITPNVPAVETTPHPAIVASQTPLDVAETRDRKGLYAKARSGQLSNFTGIDSPYEVPEHPEVRIDTTTSSPEDAVEMVLGQLRAMGVVPQ